MSSSPISWKHRIDGR
jgi:DNA replication ATP-dependent helicase Dna2